MTLLGIVGDHPWQLSPSLGFVIKVKELNSESVVYFLLEGDHPRDGRCTFKAVVNWW